jgi:dTDP-4-amino-4,6-dideoxygalactose transaminase
MNKKSIEDLAIFGGLVLFPEKLHVGRPNIGDRERFFARVNDMFDRRWLTNDGPFVEELEQRVALLLKVKHCFAVCNATVGLEITERALELKGEVIVPSFTFVASVHSLQWQGIRPVFCDVDPRTHNLDPIRVEKLITARTSGILGVHVWGRACPVEELTSIARGHDLKLVFDAAHAFGSTHRARMIGGFGNAEVFSFHATKFFNSFEGGVVTTNDDRLAEKIRSMRNFGFAGLDNVTSIGTNGKMSEVSAAMGLTSLESMDDFVDVNRNNYLAYSGGLAGLPGVQLIQYNDEEKNNYQYVVVEIEEKAAGIGRDQLVKILNAENILVRRYFYPGCHQMEPYRSDFPNAGLTLPETEKLTLKVLQLPTGTAVTVMDVNRICDLIRFIFGKAADIRNRVEQ